MTGKTPEQTFSFEIVSCLLAALSESGGVVGAKHYTLMAKIDGTKSQSGYEHMFRAVKKRAQEIKEQIKIGEIDLDDLSNPKGRKSSTMSAKAGAGDAKGMKRRKADDLAGTPTKKIKVEREAEDEDRDELT